MFYFTISSSDCKEKYIYIMMTDQRENLNVDKVLEKTQFRENIFLFSSYNVKK